MIVRIPWNKHEAAILLDACIRVEQGLVNRSEAITYVSEMLRNLAINNGQEIDLVFRNENGISMQFSAMWNCFHNKEGGLTISKIFREIVSLYELDKAKFISLVQEAKAMSTGISITKKTFAAWLIEQEKYDYLSGRINSSINTLSMIYLKARAISEPITRMDSIETVSHVLDMIYANNNPRIHSKKQIQEYIMSVNCYLEYLKNKQAGDEVITDKQTLCEESITDDIMFIDFEQPSGLAYTKPDYFVFNGEEAALAKNWTKLYVEIVNYLCKKNSKILMTLLGKNISGATCIDLVKIEDSHKMIAPYSLENGLAIETNLSASDIVKKIRSLLNLYQIDYGALKIAYHKRERNISSTSKEPKDRICTGIYTSNIVRILESHYSYGFRTNSPIELMRFRNYAQNDGISIPESDTELEKEIYAAGTLIDGKIFIFGETLLSEIGELLNAVFDGGVTVVFLKLFMEKNFEWMDEHHVTSKDMLKELLKRSSSDFYFGQNIVTRGSKNTEYEAVASEIHRVSGDNRVVWFTELSEQLEYIPSDKIAWSLSVSDDFVWISEGKYFRMDHFIIDDEESREIVEFVTSECNAKGYASITDVPLGSITEQNYELSITALHSAIYNKVLNQSYHLNGKILTRDAGGMNISILLRNFCEGRSVCTVAEVIKRATELTGAPNRQHSLIALYDTMIRVDRKKFVSEKQVHFDVNQIDSLLSDIIGDRFAPIKSVTTFALFPSCGYSWNHYLLESFCRRFSNKYQLCVLNYNDKNAGMIVSKSLSLSYNDMLCETAANADIELTVEAVGNYFFENGLTAKRKYSSLSEIIERVNNIREEC